MYHCCHILTLKLSCLLPVFSKTELTTIHQINNEVLCLYLIDLHVYKNVNTNLFVWHRCQQNVNTNLIVWHWRQEHYGKKYFFTSQIISMMLNFSTFWLVGRWLTLVTQHWNKNWVYSSVTLMHMTLRWHQRHFVNPSLIQRHNNGNHKTHSHQCCW